MPEKRYGYSQRSRLSGKRAFAAVYAAGAKQVRGPLVLFSMPNSLSHCRWGLSVSRKVGIAVQRNRIKRLLRESIRLFQRDIPAGYDFVIVLRPHKPLILAEYQKLLSHLAIQSHGRWATME